MTVNLSRLDRLILSTIAFCLVYLCVRNSADSAQAQRKSTAPMPVKIVGKFELSVPRDGLPVEITHPIELDVPKNGLRVQVVTGYAPPIQP